MDHWYRCPYAWKDICSNTINQVLNTPVILNAYWHTTVSVIKNQFNPTFFLADCHTAPLSLDLQQSMDSREYINCIYDR